MKRAITGELTWSEDWDSDWLETRIGISYVKLKPRLDTFPVAGTYETNGLTLTIPGYIVWHKFNISLLTFGLDIKSLKIGKSFCVYPGFDFMMGGIDMVYDSEYELILSEDYTGGELLAGVRFRAGAELRLDKHTVVFLEATRSAYKVNAIGYLAHNDYGAGVRINIKAKKKKRR